MNDKAILIQNYISHLFAPEDDILQKVRKNARENGLPDIEISSSIGKLLYLLVKMQKPKRVLEIGTLGGYSTIWIARGLGNEGHILTLEINRECIQVAKQNLAMAGFLEKVEIREGTADLLMDQMLSEKEEPFDFIFIDADKANYPKYLTKALALSRVGTLIITDDLIPRGGALGNGEYSNLASQGIYDFNEKIANHPRLESILIPTIEHKGRLDAVGISLVTC